MKFLFDECFTKLGAYALAELLKLYDPPQTSYYLEDFLGEKGVLDQDWTELIKDDSEWLVVSFDRGSSGKVKSKGEPLHIVCPRKRITGVYLSGTQSQASKFEKVRAVLCVLPDILNVCPRAPRGSRFKINKHLNTFTFSEWPVKNRERERFS